MTRFRLSFLTFTLLVCLPTRFAAQSLIQPMVSAKPLNAAEEEAGSITIPAGTSVLMRLRSPLNTVSAQSGSGLYLETIADVIQQNRIVIPAKTLVQGLVEQRARPGRVKGRGQLQFHFTTLILPSNYTAAIAGSLQSLPGSAAYESRNREGAIQPVDQIDKDAAILVSSVMAGAAIGSLTHGDFRAGRGAMIGAAYGIGKILFKRGDDIHLPAGANVEMVLDRPVTLPLQELARYTKRTEAPVEQAPAPAARPTQEQRPRLPSSATATMVPGGMPAVTFHW